MKKSVIAVFIAGLLSAGLLTGCSNHTVFPEPDAAPSAGQETGKESAEANMADNGETVTVKWLMFGEKAKDHDLVLEDLNKKLKEKINVELDLVMIPQGEFNDKVKIASAFEDDFDLVFTSNWINRFDENMSREAYLPLDDLLEEYGQDIKSSVPDWLMDVAKVDGRLYAIPNQQIIASQYGVAIQKEYADKYGFDLTSLESISDLYPFLDQLVAKEPDKFPVDYRGGGYLSARYEALVGEYVFIDKNDPEGKLVSAVEAMDEELRMNHEWYQRGYFRKDVVAITDNSADVKAKRYICSTGTYKPGWDAEFAQRTGVEYVTVPVEGVYLGALNGTETMTAINSNSRHPEEAMKLLNLVYTDKEIYNELLYGIEGVHYNLTSENHAQPVAGNKYNIYSTYAWKLGNQFNAYYLPGQEDGLWEATDQLNREARISPLRGFVFDPVNVRAVIAQLTAVTEEFRNGQFTADDIEQFLEDRNAKLKQAGLDTLMEEVQRQVDVWKASKSAEQ